MNDYKRKVYFIISKREGENLCWILGIPIIHPLADFDIQGVTAERFLCEAQFRDVFYVKLKVGEVLLFEDQSQRSFFFLCEALSQRSFICEAQSPRSFFMWSSSQRSFFCETQSPRRFFCEAQRPRSFLCEAHSLRSFFMWSWKSEKFLCEVFSCEHQIREDFLCEAQSFE